MFFTVAMRIASAPVSGERMKKLIHASVWRELILGFLAYLARFKKTLMSHLRSEEDGKKNICLAASMGLGTSFSTFARKILGKDFCHVSLSRNSN